MEYSPFQKFPKKGGRVDVRAGTIESDPDFVAFLASINGVGTVPTSNGAAPADGTAPSAEGTAGTMSASPSGSALPNDPLSVPLPSGEKPEKPKSTPLIDFLRQQKATAAAEKAVPGSSKAKSPKDGKDGKEVASSSSRRSDKRRMEKIRAKGKERDDTGKEEKAIKQAIRAVDMETATILSREWSGPRREGSISTSGRDRESKVDKVAAGETEKPKRERRRGGNAAVAAILQRDLGLAGPRRSRGNKPALESATPIMEEGTAPSRPIPAAVMSNSPPAINAQLSHIGPQPSTQEATPKTPRQRGGSRRDRRNRLDREDSTASVASTSSPPPIAILKKQPSSGPSPISPSGPEVPTLLKRQSSASGPPPTAPSGPASSTPASHATPTAPKGDSGRRRHGRGEGRGGANVGGSGSGGGRNPRPPVDTQPTQQQSQPAMPGVPTAPAGDTNQPSGREGRGRRGNTSGGGSGGGGGGGGGGVGGGGGRNGFRGGRGRGGGQGRGRGGLMGVSVAVAGGGGEGTS